VVIRTNFPEDYQSLFLSITGEGSPPLPQRVSKGPPSPSLPTYTFAHTFESSDAFFVHHLLRPGTRAHNPFWPEDGLAISSEPSQFARARSRETRRESPSGARPGVTTSPPPNQSAAVRPAVVADCKREAGVLLREVSWLRYSSKNATVRPSLHPLWVRKDSFGRGSARGLPVIALTNSPTPERPRPRARFLFFVRRIPPPDRRTGPGGSFIRSIAERVPA